MAREREKADEGNVGDRSGHAMIAAHGVARMKKNPLHDWDSMPPHLHYRRMLFFKEGGEQTVKVKVK